jgi:two-component sensor histidine kinase
MVESWAHANQVNRRVRDTVDLIVSELATNSVRHARTFFEVTIEVVDGSIEIRVFDADTRMPFVIGTDEDATGGRGMQIVASTADGWGSHTEVRDGIPGKTVWARVAAARVDDGS